MRLGDCTWHPLRYKLIKFLLCFYLFLFALKSPLFLSFFFFYPLLLLLFAFPNEEKPDRHTNQKKQEPKMIVAHTSTCDFPGSACPNIAVYSSGLAGR